MKKVTLVVAALALTAGGSAALADDSGHLSVNTLKSEQWGHRHHVSGSSAAIRDAVPRDEGRRGVVGIATLGDTRMTAPPRIRPRGLTPTMIEGTSMARPMGMARLTTTQDPTHTAIRRGRTLTGGTTLTGPSRLSDHWASSRRSSMRPSRRREPSSMPARGISIRPRGDGSHRRRRLSGRHRRLTFDDGGARPPSS